MESAPKSSVSEKRKPVRRKYLKASGCAEKGAVVSFASELSEKFSRAGGGINNVSQSMEAENFSGRFASYPLFEEHPERSPPQANARFSARFSKTPSPHPLPSKTPLAFSLFPSIIFQPPYQFESPTDFPSSSPELLNLLNLELVTL